MWRQEDQKYKVIFGYIPSSRPAWVTCCLKISKSDVSFFSLKHLFFICVSVLPAFIYVYHMCVWCPWRLGWSWLMPLVPALWGPWWEYGAWVWDQLGPWDPATETKTGSVRKGTCHQVRGPEFKSLTLRGRRREFTLASSQTSTCVSLTHIVSKNR